MFIDPEKSLNVFSSSGNLTQCDNALKCALNGALTVSCSAKSGSVIASFKNTSVLVNKKSYHKIFKVCPTIGVGYAGLQPDFRKQLSLAQSICQEYYDVYGEWPSLRRFVGSFSLSIQQFTQKGGLRPFGTFLVFVGMDGTDREGGCLSSVYQIDPSGSYRCTSVVAAGVGYEDARKFLERRLEGLDDNVANCILALREFSGKSLSPEDVSIGVFSDGGFKVFSQEEVEEVFDSLKN